MSVLVITLVITQVITLVITLVISLYSKITRRVMMKEELENLWNVVNTAKFKFT